MDNYAQEPKRIWLTLFDHLDDDLYDGDFTYDDGEIPRILLEYREASERQVKSTNRVTESAAKSSEKKEMTSTSRVTTTTYTRTTHTTSSGNHTTNVRTTHTTGSSASPQTYQQSSSRVTYEPVAQFEIGEEPRNSNGCDARHLEEELRANNQTIITDLSEEQVRRFQIEDDRADALAFLERAHEELKGENAQDIQETRKLEEIKRDVDTEIQERTTKINTEVDIIKQQLTDVDKLTKATQQEHTEKTKENTSLQETLAEPEDLMEQGFSQEARDIRNENSHLKNQFENNTADLLKERDERDKVLDDHNATVRAFNDTIYKYNGLLLETEQAKKIQQDHLHDVQHQLSQLDDSNDHLEQRIQITDIDIESLSQAVESLRKDYSTSDKVFSEHISELSEIIVDQNREIAELKNQFNTLDSRNRELQNDVEKQKLDLQDHEKEMDAINAIGYEDKIGQLQDDLRKIDETRRRNQDSLENAQEGLTAKLTIFKDEMDKRKKNREEMEKRVAYELGKLNDVQLTINDLLKSIDDINNRLVVDANKDTVDTALKNERENHKLKLRWATEEREKIRNDMQEAIALMQAKQQEVRDQEAMIRELKKQVADLKTIIEEKKKIIAELEREIEKANERIEFLIGKIRDLDALIAQLQQTLMEREARLRELQDILGAQPEPEINYKAVKGDEVDEMLAMYMKDCPVPVKRLGGGFYLFGTRKIYAKIMNGKLVVRVGGGYMFISEFIASYSEPEINKLTKICENLGIDSIWDLDLEELYYSKSGGGSPLHSPGRGGASPGGFGGNASFKKSMKGKTGKANMNGTNRTKKFNASAIVR